MIDRMIAPIHNPTMMTRSIGVDNVPPRFHISLANVEPMIAPPARASARGSVFNSMRGLAYMV